MTQPQGSELADNALLSRLPAVQRKRLQALGRTRRLALDTVVAGATLPRGPLLFPLSGFVALSSGQGPWGQVQLILVGSEGAIGASAVFDAEMGVLCASVRAECTARVIERRDFSRMLLAAPGLRPLLQCYQSLQLELLARAALCLGFHAAEPRLARWLLAAADRSALPLLEITHQRLALLLGVRRSAVTVSAGHLHACGLIDYRRGRIRIVDRAGLERASCACWSDDRVNHLRAFPASTGSA
jgi:CRP-like cAMP-binding protein